MSVVLYNNPMMMGPSGNQFILFPENLSVSREENEIPGNKINRLPQDPVISV